MAGDFPTFQISLTTGGDENSFYVDIELGRLLGMFGMFGMFREFPLDTFKILTHF